MKGIKTGGRSAGTPNRTTKEAKELLEQILFDQVDTIKNTLEQIKEKDPARYLEIVTKLLAFVIPKKSDISSDITGAIQFAKDPFKQIRENAGIDTITD